jgi:hypothetical protein
MALAIERCRVYFEISGTRVAATLINLYPFLHVSWAMNNTSKDLQASDPQPISGTY